MISENFIDLHQNSLAAMIVQLPNLHSHITEACCPEVRIETPSSLRRCAHRQACSTRYIKTWNF